ncbi:MAG: helix-turn-helix domain-containing protein [Planctomycetota bacterium]
MLMEAKFRVDCPLVGNGMKRASVSQSMIADRAGVDRTTVNKILNGYRGDRSSPETIEKVMETARGLGYNFGNLILRRNRRREDRKLVDIGVDVALHLEDGTVFDRGMGRLRDVSRSGALLAGLVTERRQIPLDPFYCVMTAREAPLSGMALKGRFLRLRSNGRVDFGIKFDIMGSDGHVVLERFLADANEEVTG